MIKIKTEKIVERGEQRRKILEVFALTEKELPMEYMGGYPRVWYNGSYLTIRESEWNTYYFNPSDSPKLEKNFISQLGIIVAAGNRLKEINKKLEAGNKDWHGEETFLI